MIPLKADKVNNQTALGGFLMAKIAQWKGSGEL